MSPLEALARSAVSLGAGALLVASPPAHGAPAPAPSSVPPPAAAELKPGGATTLEPGRKPGIAAPFATLDESERFELGVGRAFFRDPWVAAPATTTARDGLGPLYNAHACVSCHPDGGRGALGPDGAPSSALLLRLGRTGVHDAGVLPGDPVYGDQLQTLAISAGGAGGAAQRPVREAVVSVTYEDVAGDFADGTTYVLRRPRWSAGELAYGPLDPATRASARIAPAVRGAGLLDAIGDAAILARADPDDRDGDGISGRASRVRDVATGEERVGRFGWKALQPTLAQQVASALRNDLGITSELYPEQPCSAAQASCVAAPDGGDPPSDTEITPLLFAKLVRFTATLALPARGAARAAAASDGRALFRQIGCASCHVPSFTTGDTVAPHAARQTIWPYSDLLLHDLGPGLADEVGEGDASGAEWRTAPLWGLGRATRDPASTSLLHDGRARSSEEAILWHGGEAEGARASYRALPRERREALLAFLATL
jgi:CxxC motif-containing protein (DUF1111 family)